MATKRYLLEVLLVSIVGLYSDVNGEWMRVYFPHSLDIFSLLSPGYPNHAPHGTDKGWDLIGDGGRQLELFCDDITLLKSTGCRKGVLTIWEGLNRTNICSTTNSYSRVSKGNRMQVHLSTDDSGFGKVRCGVRLVPIPEDDPPLPRLPGEPESLEEGVGPQLKQTSCPCGWRNKNKKRIVGGQETEDNEFVFMAYLRRQDHYEAICTGSILTVRHVLTTASGVYNKLNLMFQVVVGGHNIIKGSNNSVAQTMEVQTIHIHNDFNKSTFLNDIAILELTQNIKFGEFVGPVCLPSERYSLDNQWVKAMGWGELITNGPSAPTLRKVNLQVLDLETCKKFHKNLDIRGRTQLCSFTPHRDICKGDGGGPLIHIDSELNRYVIVALGSYGHCANRIPSVSTDVRAFFDWIQSIIFNYRGKDGEKPVQTCEKLEL